MLSSMLSRDRNFSVSEVKYVSGADLLNTAVTLRNVAEEDGVPVAFDEEEYSADREGAVELHEEEADGVQLHADEDGPGGAAHTRALDI